jgi:hypothetical protein
MTLELTPRDGELLREILEHELRKLGPEIRHTDSRAFREELKRRYDELESLRERLEPAGSAVM